MSISFREKIPIELVTHVTAMCGSKADVWFDSLPNIIRILENEWQLKVRVPFPGIEYNYVAPATTDAGVEVVVKIAPPFEHVEIFGEAAHLKILAGNGEVAFLAEDRERQAILVERALPGEALYDVFKDDPFGCVQPAINVLKAILRDPSDAPDDVETLDGWFDNFRRSRVTDFPTIQIDRAFEIYERLSIQTEHVFYLHGDFHLGNIVSSNRAPFLAIDPKGIVGHVGYDLAVFLINLYRWQSHADNVMDLLSFTISEFSMSFNIPETEIREWGVAHTVIGAWWNFDDMPEHYDEAVAIPDIWGV